MTDIVVRVPVRETEHFWEEPPPAPFERIEWWKMGTAPQHFLKGDRIYFALGESVVAYAEKSTHLREGALLSEDERVWVGKFVVWDVKDFVKLEREIPLSTLGLQVPRGFAYCSHTPLRTLLAAGHR